LSSQLDPAKHENPTRRILALSLLGVAFAGVCILFIIAFIWFQPDQFSLSDRYFPSSTATFTQTPTPTPTPNLAATQRALQATSTSQAIQTTIAHADSQWNILISDSFNLTKNNWGLSDEDAYSKIIRTIDNGTYTWEATSKQGFISSKTASTKSVTDFLLTVEAQRTAGTRSSDYGLIFRKDAILRNFYYFGINNNSFFVALYYKDKWIDLVDWTESSFILPASPNRLTVIATGSYFTFLVNDQLVAIVTDNHISQGRTGLAIQIHQAKRHAIFEFDNFELREP